MKKAKLHQKKLPSMAGPKGDEAKFSRPRNVGRGVGSSSVSGKVSTHGHWNHPIMDCASGSPGDHNPSVGRKTK